MSIAYSSFNHPLRVPLAAEVHSRPYLRLDVPENISHLAVYAGDAVVSGESNAAIQHRLLADLCAHFGVAAPGTDAKYFFHDFGRFRLKWESHTEFATYTFAQRGEEGGGAQDPFSAMPLSNVPQRWLLGLEGKIMVAAHVLMERSREAVPEFVQRLPRMFEGGLWVGSRVLGEGEVWTDFQIQSDGFTRFVVRDHGLSEQQHGRLAQRLLEIETYRMMAMLGLPKAQAALPVLNQIEAELATLTAQMTDARHGDVAERSEEDADGESALLTNITGLAARLEKMSVENGYRFSASQAYFRLVHARIEELREQRIAGYPTIGEFMERRLTPAQSTCAAVARRQETMAARIAHTNDLLRTRVGIVQEQQNRRILQSMNARAAQQLRLQQAVEGLSVAAISYYMIGLFGYAGKAAKAAGLPINADMLTGLLVPVVAVGVWLGLRRMHKQMHMHEK
ncbi:Uncharacterized membrane-anchored protein [Noviherbaspirillum humi]|uniref:Uncharacterized membrane-anchored protein n=1 Tax=Noviherbaspirillum humi TaxID=1688639 RepID=A0A239D641_9BURK|nr:DUF3422 domain-containing protein [Noviherbaspirillum humi]SNS27855.1 Uncharacterized membrane-anchored protein [Noviherbaspirillum humi]